MNEPWYSLLNIEVSENSISAKVVVSADSPWFSGHFPGELTPGIAELSMIFDIIKNKLFKQNSKKLKILSLKKSDLNSLLNRKKYLIF